MKASELRIGNLINTTYGVLPITGIKDGTIYYKESSIGSTHGGNPEPITITEEWLVKFGFTFKEAPMSAYNWDCNKSFDGGVLRGGYSKLSGYSYFGFIRNGVYVNFKSVHQLQNLYFALTGEELNIK